MRAYSIPARPARRIYTVPAAMQDLIHLLPLFAGAAGGRLRGIGVASSNGIEGTLLPSGVVQYSGASLGLPFDVYSPPGAPVYGPLAPPPGVQPAPVSPAAAADNYSYTPPPPPQDATRAAVDFNAGRGIDPEVLTDFNPEAPDDPTNIGKDTGDTFTYGDLATTAEDWLARAAELAPWYAWAAAGGGALILFGAIIHRHHHYQRKKR